MKATLAAYFRSAFVAVHRQLTGGAERPNFLHPGWLNHRMLHRVITGEIGDATGTVLDVGCGAKPYSAAIRGRHIGLEIAKASVADLLYDGLHFPVRDGSIDAVLCTEVLEHAEAPDLLIEEITRCLKPGGAIVLSAPFVYGEHGRPHDFRRFTADGLRRAFESDFEVLAVHRVGALGTVVVRLVHTCISAVLDVSHSRRVARAGLLPLDLALTGLLNAVGWIVDAVDRSGAAYAHTVIVGRKRIV